MDGGESVSGLHQLHQLLTIADCPLLWTKRSGDGRAKGKGLTCRVLVEGGRGRRVCGKTGERGWREPRGGVGGHRGTGGPGGVVEGTR